METLTFFAGVLRIFVILIASSLALAGLFLVGDSVARDRYTTFELGLISWVLAAVFGVIARLLRPFEL